MNWPKSLFVDCKDNNGAAKYDAEDSCEKTNDDRSSSLSPPIPLFETRE